MIWIGLGLTATLTIVFFWARKYRPGYTFPIPSSWVFGLIIIPLMLFWVLYFRFGNLGLSAILIAVYFWVRQYRPKYTFFLSGMAFGWVVMLLLKSIYYDIFLGILAYGHHYSPFMRDYFLLIPPEKQTFVGSVIFGLAYSHRDPGFQVVSYFDFDIFYPTTEMYIIFFNGVIWAVVYGGIGLLVDQFLKIRRQNKTIVENPT